MAKKYYSRSEKEKLAKKLAAVVAVFVIVCTATGVIGHIVDNQKMNTGQKDAAAASDIVTINGVKCKPNWDVQTVLSMNWNRILWLCQCVDKLNLFLTRMSGNVSILENNAGSLLGKLIHYF